MSKSKYSEVMTGGSGIAIFSALILICIYGGMWLFYLAVIIALIGGAIVWGMHDIESLMVVGACIGFLIVAGFIQLHFEDKAETKIKAIAEDKAETIAEAEAIAAPVEPDNGKDFGAPFEIDESKLAPSLSRFLKK